MKKIIVLFLVMTLVLIPIGVSAEEENTQVNKIISVVNGEATEITEEQYNDLIEEAIMYDKYKENLRSNLKNDEKSQLFMISRLGVAVVKRYEESGSISNYAKYNEKRRVSSVKHNSTSNTTSHTISFSVTQSSSANVSISAKYEDIIEAAIGWEYSDSITKGSEDTYLVSPNHYGWVEYTPYMYNSWGNIIKQNYYGGGKPGAEYKEYVDLYFPKDAGDGLPDGIYKFEESKTCP